MARTLPSIIASPAWAIDSQYPLAHLAKALQDHTAADVSEEQLRTSGRFHHVVNPDGEVIGSMDPEYSRRIKQGAVAVIPVKGVMVKECARWMEVFGLCSSDRVARDIDLVAADQRVQQIVCVVNSPGGDIAGVENLDRTVQAAAKKKKLTAFADGMMASAAYWAFAHATAIVADGATTTVGSLGVMTTIEDDSAFWKAMGIDARDIYDATSGDKNKEWRAAVAGDVRPMQDRLAPLKAAMVAAVTDGRKGVIDRTREDVLTGKVYSGNEAKAFGLVDRIDSLKAVLGEAIAPDTTPNTPNPFTNTATMKFQDLWARALTALGITDAKPTATADDITAANAALKESGLALVTIEQATELAGLADLKAKAAQVADLQAKATEAEAAAKAIQDNLAAALKECGIEAEAGKAAELAITTLKKGPAATPTGAPKAADEKPKQWDSVKAFEAATIPQPAAQ